MPTATTLIPSNIPSTSVDSARDYFNQGQYADAWNALAEGGDRYADNAAGVLGYEGDTVDVFFESLVKNHWENTVGKEAYDTKFNEVAGEHLDKYLKHLENGYLPDTQFIVESYETALTDKGLDKSAAFDGAWANAVPGNSADPTWGFPFLGMEASRSTTSDATNGLTGEEARELIWQDLKETIKDIDALDLGSELFVDMLNRFGEGTATYLGDLFGTIRDVVGDAYLDLSNVISDFFRDAQNWAPRRGDPMILDLDGDGLEVIPNGGANGILFDHDGDGNKASTSWIAADDGFLVRDVNGNGTIDTGRELFGDSTVKGNGDNAIDGFDALADLDSNGDGIIDSNDLAFNQLQVWQDVNSDGISQANELKTLSELNIESIALARTANSEVLADGSRIADLGTFTYSSGSSGGLAVGSGSLGDVDLREETFYSQFSDQVPLTAAAQLLPDMKGSGQVRNLSESASLSSSLTQALQNYSAATTREQQLGLLDNLVQQWSETSAMPDVVQRALEAGFIVNYSFGLQVGSNTTDTSSFASVTMPAGDDSQSAAASFAWDLYTQNTTADYQKWIDRISILERFNGRGFIDFADRDVSTETPALSVNPSTGGSGGTAGFGFYTVNINISDQQMNMLEQSHNALRDSVYKGLLVQTRLKEFSDGISLGVDAEGKLVIDRSGIEQVIANRITADPANGVIDTMEFYQASGFLSQAEWESIGELIQNSAVDANLQAALDEFGIQSINSVQGFVDQFSDNIRFGSDNSEDIYGGVLGDVLIGYGGDDTLKGSETTYAGAGGSNVLIGGKGNDTLYGRLHDDTYFFEVGDGADLLIESGSPSQEDTIIFGPGISATDISFVRNVDYRFGEDLIFTHSNGVDSVTVLNWFANNEQHQVENIQFSNGTALTGNDITASFLEQYGTDIDDNFTGFDEYDDRLFGGDGVDTLSGLGGNDYIEGNDGDDILDGGFGGDVIYGGLGEDTISVRSDYSKSAYVSGGEGNDHIISSGDNTVFQFYLGDGDDVIQKNYKTYIGDTLLFGSGINSSDITYVRNGSNLVVQHNNGTDSVTFTDWFSPENLSYGLNTNIEFATGDIWAGSAITENALTIQGGTGIDTLAGVDYFSDRLSGGDGTDDLRGNGGDDYLFGESGDDKVFGGDGNDVLSGGDGDDKLYGNRDNDQLSGGAGVDILIGDRGSDTYFFNLGDGDDTISESPGTYNSEIDTTTDVLHFGAGILPSDIIATRDVNNLVLAHINGTDKVTVEAWFILSTGIYRLDQIIFDDGTIWDTGFVTNAAISSYDHIVGTSIGEEILGTRAEDIIDGAGGDDTLSGWEGNDQIHGGAGSDTLYGNEGNDHLFGGIGNDILDGGVGNDVYHFNIGDGDDRIVEDTGVESTDDVLKFGDNISPDDIARIRVGDDMVFAHVNGVDKVTIPDFFNLLNAGQEILPVDRAEFSDGTIWTGLDLIEESGVASPPPVDAVIHGTTNSETLSGTSGDDILYGDAGNDTLNGWAGNDKLYGEADNDTLEGNGGNDELYGGDGSDTLNASDGDDHLFGGSGNDTLNGAAGNDTHYFNLNDGADTINEIKGNSYTDILKFGDGITAADITRSRPESSPGVSSNDMVYSHSNGTDSVTVKNWFLYASGWHQLDQVQFADSTIWEGLALTEDTGTVNPPPVDPGIHGTVDSETLSGTSGDDILYGDAGDDILNGWAGNDKLYGEADNDTLEGNSGNDELYGGDGTDTLNASDGDDHLSGGTGLDTLNGAAGNDTYYFNSGDGADTINEIKGNTYTDILKFGAGISAADITRIRPELSPGVLSNDMVYSHSNGTDSVTVKNWFLYGSGWHQLDQVEFGDGTVWEGLALTEDTGPVTPPPVDPNIYGDSGDNIIDGTVGNDVIYGKEGNDTIKGLAGADTLYGELGNDVLKGGGGADTLIGGLGNDTLAGSTGDDQYIFARGDGVDGIADNDSTAQNSDVLEFAAGIDHDQLWFSQFNNHLRIDVIGTSDRVNVWNWFDSPDRQIEQISAGDGSVLLNTQVDQLVQAMAGFAPPASGDLELSTDLHTQLDPVLAANWQ